MKQEFIAWMNEKKLSAREVGQALGVSAQTIRNWRAGSVPKRRCPHVRQLMEEWDFDKKFANKLGRFILRPRPDEFRLWNHAAISRQPPMTVEDWAMRALNDAAEKAFSGGMVSEAADENTESRQVRRQDLT